MGNGVRSSHSRTFKLLPYLCCSPQVVLRAPDPSSPSSPMRRPHSSYRIFMPQSPKWEASRRQSLPVMLFGSNNICSCSKSSGGSLGQRGSSERGIRETQSVPHTLNCVCTLCGHWGRNLKSPPASSPGHPTSPVAWRWLRDRGWHRPGFFL